MNEADVVDNGPAKRANSKQERGDRGHDESFVARDTHVPKRKVCASLVDCNMGEIRQYLHQINSPMPVRTDQKVNYRKVRRLQKRY